MTVRAVADSMLAEDTPLRIEPVATDRLVVWLVCVVDEAALVLDTAESDRNIAPITFFISILRREQNAFKENANEQVVIKILVKQTLIPIPRAKKIILLASLRKTGRNIRMAE